jgi:hypothetical protein
MMCASLNLQFLLLYYSKYTLYLKKLQRFFQTNVSGHCNGQHKQNIMTKKLNNIV